MGARKRLRAEKLKDEKKTNGNCAVEQFSNFAKKNENGCGFDPWR